MPGLDIHHLFEHALDRSALVQHHLDYYSTLFSCDKCTYQGLAMEELLKHLARGDRVQGKVRRQRTGMLVRARPYNFCKEIFGKQAHLIEHLKTVHGEKEPWRCEHDGCPRRFKHEATAWKHANKCIFKQET
jgi:hypothetical protein